MGFMMPTALVRRSKSDTDLDTYEACDVPDARRPIEVRWWREFKEHGLKPEQARKSAQAYSAAFEELEETLSEAPWLAGKRISILEIAWFISINRLARAGYPIERHPRLARHYEALLERPAFADEAQADLAGPVKVIVAVYRQLRRLMGTPMVDVVDFSQTVRNAASLGASQQGTSEVP